MLLHLISFSAAFYRPGVGMVHCRNMDWDLPGTREATILTHFINGPAQACVVEVMPKGDNYYWEYDGKNPLAITNHEPDDEEFEDDGDDKNGWTDSIPRLKKITELSKKCKSKKR